MTRTQLPIDDCLDALRAELAARDDVVLEAPPGAGKTTRVPLALLDQPWLGDRRILMLEPRRIAARNAAYRLASQLGEEPGQTVGYRMRLDSKTGPRTRIEVITEGILTRMLQDDPGLDGVGLVIFDEFHERSLDSDLALALCLQGRELFASDGNRLKLLVMSATLDGEAVAKLLDDAAIVRSEGRAYPVEVIYGKARRAGEDTLQRVVATVRQAVLDNPRSSLLIFLPGQGEIHRCHDALRQWLRERSLGHVHLRPLYGNLSIDEQQAAIAPLDGKLADDCKIVLATNIAETSLTIEGVDVVVDSGLERVARFDPNTGMSGLHTQRIARDSSEQRAGRAGRLRPGRCYRLWSAEQQQQLAQQRSPEIASADLAPLALQLLRWGVDDPAQLRWLDPPPRGPWRQSLDLLTALGALERRDEGVVLNAHGEAMSALPLHPRLAHLLLRGGASGHLERAALLASLLSERDPFGDEPDIEHRLEILAGERACPAPHRGWQARTRQLAARLQHQAESKGRADNQPAILVPAALATAWLLACAFPDRVARKRHSGGYQLANGRSARLAGGGALGKQRWLAVAEVTGHAAGDIIRSAAALDETLFDGALNALVSERSLAHWDRREARFVAERQRCIGALVLHRERLDEIPLAAKRAALVDYLREQELRPLPWTAGLRQWCARVALLHALDTSAGWPATDSAALMRELDDWLGPYLDPVTTLRDIERLDLSAILHARLTWEQQQRLAQQAPERLEVPSGSKIAIDYEAEPPVLAVKLQEMFGCEQTPTIADGRVALRVHLLSPAGRPLQITQDLAGFWRSSYQEVRKEMKGRYPKHPWPDDPLAANPTRHTRHRKGG